MKKINRLKFNRGYLCGAMDHAADNGIGWRQKLISELTDLQIIWLDPTRKPINIGVEDVENKERRNVLKQLGNYDAVCSDMKVIRSVDLRMTDISDFLVANLDLRIFTTGTMEEIFNANREKKPIIVRMEQGKQNCPDWIFGTLPHSMIFSTWQEVHNYLRHIAHDPVIEHQKRWYFFNYNILNPKR